MLAEMRCAFPHFIVVDIATQTLQFYQQGQLRYQYAVSTAKNGAGEQFNSGCTPRGLHIIRAKIGEKAACNSVFVGRRWTGELYSAALGTIYPSRDWILTRILWLSGCEVGKNRLGSVDTMQRYIYIHGTPEENLMGYPGSRGCIRMRNEDIMSLFDAAPLKTPVMIKE